MNEDAATDTRRDDDLPDAAQFWRWAAKATRPHAGWALVVVGALFIIGGYLGVSREADVAKQMPYLISGGIGGVVLVAVGAFLLGTEDLRRQLSRLDDIEGKVHDLHRALLRASDDEVSANGSVRGSAGDGRRPAPARARRRARTGG